MVKIWKRGLWDVSIINSIYFIYSLKTGICRLINGRFAVDEEYSHKGLGSEILRSILFNVKNIAENNVRLRFVIVEGYVSVYKFYTGHNFINLKKDDDKIKEKLDLIIERNPEQTFYLYLDLRVLEWYLLSSIMPLLNYSSFSVWGSTILFKKSDVSLPYNVGVSPIGFAIFLTSYFLLFKIIVVLKDFNALFNAIFLFL